MEANSNKLSSEIASSKPPSISGAFRHNRLGETGPTAKTSSNGFSSPAVTVRTASCSLNSSEAEKADLLDKSGLSASVQNPEAKDYNVLLDTIQGYQLCMVKNPKRISA